jgi:hypothetical protein
MVLGFGRGWQPPTPPKYHYHNFVPCALLTKTMLVFDIVEEVIVL